MKDRLNSRFRGVGPPIFNDAITLSCIDQNSCAARLLTPFCMQSRGIPEMIQGGAQFCVISFSDDDNAMRLERPSALPRLANGQ
jgi:hypothetical protein